MIIGVALGSGRIWVTKMRTVANHQIGLSESADLDPVYLVYRLDHPMVTRPKTIQAR